MKALSKIFTVIANLILSLINLVLIIVVIINILFIISTRITKDAYPTILDYSYFAVNKTDTSVNLTNGDFLIIDFRKAIATNDIVMYQDENNAYAGKITDINNSEVTIKRNDEEKTIKKDYVLGPMVVNLPQVGIVLDYILQPLGFVISIVILVITGSLQNLLNKKIRKDSQKKPDFKQMQNI